MDQYIIDAIKSKADELVHSGLKTVQPSVMCQDAAIEFLSSLPTYYQHLLNPAIHVTPHPIGIIVFDWYYMKQFVCVEVGDTKISYFTDFKDGINPENNGSFLSIRSLVVSALNKLYHREDI